MLECYLVTINGQLTWLLWKICKHLKASFDFIKSKQLRVYDRLKIIKQIICSSQKAFLFVCIKEL